MKPKVFDRTYSELKREVTSGRYLPGQRLQARALADALRTSTSPVINAMRQLVGEDILHYSANDGFVIPRVTEQRLRSLYCWNRWLTTVGLTEEAVRAPALSACPAERPAVLAATEALFLAIAATDDSAEFARSANNTNARLRSTRLLEPLVFADVDEELEALIATWHGADPETVRRALNNYHQRRFDVVSRLVGLSYQDRR